MSKQSEKNKGLDKIIENTFNHIKDIVDANTVVGDIIKLGNNLFLIPVSKISVGLISGGGNISKNNKNINAGSGTGFNIVPIGFITVSDTLFNYLPVNNSNDVSKAMIDALFKVYEYLDNKGEKNEK